MTTIFYTKKKHSHPWLGKKHSEESKNKMSVSQKELWKDSV